MAITIINLSDQVSALVSKTNEISTDVGDASFLLNNDSNVVDAVNKVGTISQLNRSASNLVAAINLVDSALTVNTTSTDSDFTLMQSHYSELISITDSNYTLSQTQYLELDARADSHELEQAIQGIRLDQHDSDFGSLSTMRSTISGAPTVADGIVTVYSLITNLDSNLTDVSGGLITTARGGLTGVNSGTGFGDLSYDSTGGVFTFDRVTNTEIRSVFSVTDAGGDGSFAYDSATGKYTYTGPSASEVRAHFSAGEGIDLAAGVISGEDASTTNKGVALFSSANFAVSGGTVTIKDGGIVEAELANDAVSADKLKSVQTLIIYNSGGSAIKTIYGAGS